MSQPIRIDIDVKIIDDFLVVSTKHSIHTPTAVIIHDLPNLPPTIKTPLKSNQQLPRTSEILSYLYTNLWSPQAISSRHLLTATRVSPAHVLLPAAHNFRRAVCCIRRRVRPPCSSLSHCYRRPIAVADNRERDRRLSGYVRCTTLAISACVCE